MGGGLMQLVLFSSQDQYIIQNPQMSYFKYVYKRHTNFSMESIPLTFSTNPIMMPDGEGSTYECTVKRYGDLLSNIYFCFTLPNIYSSDVYKFRWIENVGNIFIRKATVTVGNAEIDALYGEWLSIWNELSLKDSGSYNRLVGNISELANPTINEPRIGIKNNKFYYVFYPHSNYSKGDKPSIKSKRLYVPLNFWFTRNPALALPLLKLQLAEIKIKIETRSSERLYQVYSTILDRYVAPTYYNELHNDSINIYTFAPNISLDPYIEANYIFLGNIERNAIMLSGITQYLIEQVKVSTETSIQSASSTFTSVVLNANQHIKEIIWTVRRDDYMKYNIFNNYTASPEYNEYSKILTESSIIWNSTNTRIDKDADYFSYLQSYQHHTNVPRVGIYCYSFALFPEKVNASGSYNGSKVSTTLRVKVDGTYNNNEINAKLAYHNKTTYNFQYLLTTYSITLNVFEVNGGYGLLKFS